jgi:pyridoxamine 5'-phosphate oxidase-like protein
LEVRAVATWAEFATAAPAIATAGRGLINRTETGQALLSTVRDDEPPRIHPIYVAVLDGRLVAFIILRSAKATDLAEDGRYALHTHQDPDEPHEFLVRGRARPIDDPATRAGFADAWYFEVDDTYRLFEFLVDHAMLGERPTLDDWPPVYTSWRDTGG